MGVDAVLVLGAFNCKLIVFILYSDLNIIWRYFLHFFMINLWAIELFVLVEIFNCSNSLS